MAPVPSVVANHAASPRALVSGTVRIIVPQISDIGADLRARDFVSSATQHAALFIDGASTSAGSTMSCSSSACTISWTAALSVPMAHTFAVETDDGSTLLAQGQAQYAIVAGSNSLNTLTLSGVADTAITSAETCKNSNCTGTLTVSEVDGDPITNAGTNPSFDNGTLTFGSSNATTGSVSAGSTIGMVSTSGQYAYTVTCLAATGSFATTIAASAPTGSGAITPAELSFEGLQAYPSSILFAASTYICAAGNAITDSSSATKTVFLTSGTTFTVPPDWSSAHNTIETIGAGGGGASATKGGGSGSGGGGGAYSRISNVTLTASSNVTYAVGAAGAVAGDGGDTYFCSATTACASIAGNKVVSGAKGGKGGSAGGAGGAGGAASAGVGGTTTKGGAGGAGAANNGGGGGGGAAGPNGVGAAGGTTTSTTAAGGGGGGGSGGGNAGGNSAAPNTGGAGGSNANNVGAGASVAAQTTGAAGKNGGGGSGGGGAASSPPAPGNGGAGAPGIEYVTKGSGGGGGGGGGAVTGTSSGGLGGSGANYGGGGGGGGRSIGGAQGAGSTGGPGLIIIKYTP